MIKTIFKPENFLEITALNCGYLSKPITKQVQRLKDFAHRYQISSLAAQQVLDDFEFKIGIIYNKINEEGLFCNVKDRHNYDLIINPIILSGSKLVNITEYSVNFPFLCIARPRYLTLEVSHLTTNKKIEITKFHNKAAFQVQILNDSFNGLHLLHPWRNDSEMQVIPEFKGLFSQDFNLESFMEKYKIVVFDCSKNELMENNYNCLHNNHNIMLREYEPYKELSEALLSEYTAIKQMKYEEFISKVDGSVGDVELRRWFKVVNALCID